MARHAHARWPSWQGSEGGSMRGCSPSLLAYLAVTCCTRTLRGASTFVLAAGDDLQAHAAGPSSAQPTATVNVCDFGAVADDTTDDSTAFRAALAHAVTLSSPDTRVKVVVPGDAGGRYLVANVTLPSNVEMVGRGSAAATILTPASATFALRMNASTTLRNLHFVVVRPAP